MGQRTVRVNELLRREINELMHTRYRSETVGITVFEVSVSPDLRNAFAYYSVIGGAREQEEARQFFAKYGPVLRREVGKSVILKYLPKLNFVYDDSMERGSKTLELLDSLDEEDPTYDHDTDN